jgi:hypothetical protein
VSATRAKTGWPTTSPRYPFAVQHGTVGSEGAEDEGAGGEVALGALTEATAMAEEAALAVGAGGELSLLRPQAEATHDNRMRAVPRTARTLAPAPPREAS